ncbi:MULTISPECIES: voltage-gated potassium channel protein [Yersinia]|uniref:voltage-gated potassium channel protein n=1 Tax=Yersinia TaxID=629 RepID=UPI0011A5E3BD|nr:MULTISPECIES: voltage-gated potassium channel protein [Yersinia]MDA5544626.1 voltage-gated potassium channel protein [Yersinia rochesterensis]MDN0107453.1 voltage-gated potassium channel protein [Yersinia rochesterensis]MDR5020066.1 voltage-gated potassium channel protein [Yersinia rochesterensis]UZM75955.1 voltage-gated potassium channel protein [Yersinia sp. SCPM-O-B-9106 (C-191)]
MKILQEIKTKVSIPLLLAILVAINGYLVLSPVLFRAFSHSTEAINNFSTWKEALSFLELFEIPRFMIGLLLILMSFSVAMKIRTAWFLTVLLLFTIVAINIFILKDQSKLTTYSLIVVVALLFYWREFDHYSLGSATFFAIASICSLIVYSMLGTLYMGDEFAPAVTDLPTAFYFAIVCMSTVGFGDIIPHTTVARMFTLTVIIAGITVFAASIASIAGPIISNNIKRIVKGRIYHVERKNHFIIVGSNSLALNVYNGLRDRGDDVTVVCPVGSQHNFPPHADIIEGDPSSVETLKLAGAAKAKYIIALCNNDADNTFTILAAKEIAGEGTKTLALVNETQNMQKVKRVNPDMVFSLPLLGSELLVRTLNGDTINNSLIAEMFFGNCQKLD